MVQVICLTLIITTVTGLLTTALFIVWAALDDYTSN